MNSAVCTTADANDFYDTPAQQKACGVHFRERERGGGVREGSRFECKLEVKQLGYTGREDPAVVRTTSGGRAVLLRAPRPG